MSLLQTVVVRRHRRHRVILYKINNVDAVYIFIVIGTVSTSSKEDEELMLLLLFLLLFSEPLIKTLQRRENLSTKKRQKYSIMLENDF